MNPLKFSATYHAYHACEHATNASKPARPLIPRVPRVTRVYTRKRKKCVNNKKNNLSRVYSFPVVRVVRVFTGITRVFTRVFTLPYPCSLKNNDSFGGIKK